ncbi:MAG: hypothetical protein GC136_02375 [Alphaproteobacteria bacterium]|nr:hypothetical protein [Alphaproteobacteria bacterium]
MSNGSDSTITRFFREMQAYVQIFGEARERGESVGDAFDRAVREVPQAIGDYDISQQLPIMRGQAGIQAAQQIIQLMLQNHQQILQQAAMAVQSPFTGIGQIMQLIGIAGEALGIEGFDGEALIRNGQALIAQGAAAGSAMLNNNPQTQVLLQALQQLQDGRPIAEVQATLQGAGLDRSNTFAGLPEGGQLAQTGSLRDHQAAVGAPTPAPSLNGGLDFLREAPALEAPAPSHP